MTQAKICGIKTPEAMHAALLNGARFIGFVFYEPSPRHVEVDIAKELALMLPTGTKAVGLFVDPTDADLEKVLGKVQLDMIQLHGDESPDRVTEIRTKFAMPIIKAFPVQVAEDIDQAERYQDADWFLFDAKSSDPDMPGGTGQSFDWSLLSDKDFSKPWMLSGGLTPENVGDALSALSPDAVDVSSGVEQVRGEKSAEKIKAFLDSVKAI